MLAGSFAAVSANAGCGEGGMAESATSAVVCAPLRAAWHSRYSSHTLYCGSSTLRSVVLSLFFIYFSLSSPWETENHISVSLSFVLL